MIFMLRNVSTAKDYAIMKAQREAKGKAKEGKGKGPEREEEDGVQKASTVSKVFKRVHGEDP